jgi:hypothetical protein
MNRTALRVAVWTGVAAATVPSAVAVALVRPVAVAGAAIGRYGITANGTGVGTDGQVGASGGLVVFDAGVGSVTARIDSGPSGRASAVAVEPGSTVRTVVAQANTSAGQVLLSVPGAAAAYPGGKPSDSYTTLPDQSAGPVQAVVGTGTASVERGASADAIALGGALTLAGLLDSAGARGEAHLRADPSNARLSATASSGASDITVGPLELHDVVGSATVTSDGNRRSATSTLTVGSATVAGVPVAVDETGIHVAGQQVAPPATVTGAVPPTVTTLLAQAGLTVSVLAPVHSTGPGSALADSGGLVVRLHTAPVTTGLPVVQTVGANDVALIVGRVTVTESDGAAVPALGTVPTGSGPTSAQPGASPGPATSTAALAAPPVTGPPVIAAGSVPGPSLAGAPTSMPTRRLAFLGHRLDATAALAAFAVWQLLAGGTAGLAAVALRRRTREEERLCPCP